MTEFGRRVDEAQKDQNMSNAELAKKMKVAAPQIFSLKNKTKNPREGTLHKVAKALGKPVDFFLSSPKEALAAEKTKKANKVILRKSKNQVEPKETQIEFDAVSQAHPIEEFEQPYKDEVVPAVEAVVIPEQVVVPREDLKPRVAKVASAKPAEIEESPKLLVYVTFELNGKVVSKKQITKLPADFEF